MTPNRPSGAHRLAAFVDRCETRVGAAYPGTRAVFRGQDLHHQLQVRGWIDLCAFGITGRRLSTAQLRLLEAMWVWTSYPDPRIWNNRVAALAGTTRSTANLAMAAGHAVSEATIYGRRNEYRAVAFFIRAQQGRLAGQTLDQCIDEQMSLHKRLPGYGRPLASHDERIAPTMALARELGLAEGPHVTLAFEIDRHLREQGRPLQMNFGALISAFGADFGLTPREYTLLLFPIFLAGMQPCYLEALEKPPVAMFATPCHRVHYEGEPPRDWLAPR